MPPQQRPLIRVGNRMVPGPPVVNPNLRSLLDPNADITIAPDTLQANVSALQPAVQEPDVPRPKILDLVSQLFSDASDRSLSENLGTVVDMGKAYLGAELDKGRRLVDTAKNFNLNDAMRDLAQGASEIPGEQWGSAALTFGEGVGVPRIPLTNAEGQPLSQHQGLEWGALAAGAFLPIGPSGRAKLVGEVVDKVGDAAKALRGPAATKFDVLRKTIGEERFSQLLYDWNEAFVDPNTGRLMTGTFSDAARANGPKSVPVNKQHFLDWVLGKDGAHGVTGDDLQQWAPDDAKAVMEARDEARRLLLGEPTVAPGPAPRGAEVAAAANAKLAEGRVANPIKAYHGSPHDFDQFSMDKIGTGEGAQAYGHGLYFAEGEKTAKFYRDTLAVDPRDSINQIAKNLEPGASLDDVYFEMKRHSPQLNDFHNNSEIKRDILSIVNGRNPDGSVTSDAMSAMKRLDRVLPKPSGHMYEVEINATTDDLLDWDVPLSQQSEKVQEAWRKTMAQLPPNASDDLGGDFSMLYGDETTPKDFLNTIASFGDRNLGEKLLGQQGVPGIRYLDGQSRGHVVKLSTGKGKETYASNKFPTLAQAQKYAKDKAAEGFTTEIVQEGTRNYVIWETKVIDLLRKYGILPPVAAAAAHESTRGGKDK